MGLQDLSFVVAAHRSEFGDGFFARLGPRFLTRYYRTFLDGPTAVAVVAEADGTPGGYLTGILQTREHRALLLRFHGVGLAIRGCMAMVRHPKLGLIFLARRSSRYLHGIKRGLLSRPPSAGPSAGPGAEERTAVLTHVVVDERHRNQGLGQQLVDHFLSEAARAGCTGAALVTERGDAGAASFYEARGWTRRGSVTTPEGKSLWQYAIALSGGPAEKLDETR